MHKRSCAPFFWIYHMTHLDSSSGRVDMSITLFVDGARALTQVCGIVLALPRKMYKAQILAYDILSLVCDSISIHDSEPGSAWVPANSFNRHRIHVHGRVNWQFPVTHSDEPWTGPCVGLLTSCIMFRPHTYMNSSFKLVVTAHFKVDEWIPWNLLGPVVRGPGLLSSRRSTMTWYPIALQMEHSPPLIQRWKFRGWMKGSTRTLCLSTHGSIPPESSFELWARVQI